LEQKTAVGGDGRLRIFVVGVAENNLDVLLVGIFLNTQGGFGEN
jgi:hypothetical protein